MVKVYGKPGCVQCNMTEKALVKKGVEFTKVDVTQDDEAFDYVVNTLGYQGVPVVETAEDHWNGFKPEKIATL